MTEQHPERGLLKAFMRGEIEGSESREIVIHLLSGCEPCRRLAREDFPCETVASAEGSDLNGKWRFQPGERYSRVFEQVLPRVWESEVSLEDQQSLAPQLLEELKLHPHERRLLIVRNSRRFQSWTLCELIIEEALRQGFKNPSSAIDFGKLAVEISESLHGGRLSLELTNDLKCRAHSILGNALRISGELHEANEQFRIAEGFLIGGSGDPLERARHVELRSYINGEQRDFSSALELLNEAIRIYRGFNDLHRMGRALIARGHQLGEQGDIRLAVASLRQGLRYIDSDQEPRLVLVAKHNLVHHLYQAGRYHQARVLLPETRELHSQLGSELDQIRFSWLEGVILRDSGDQDDAEVVLDRVKQFFVDRRIAHDAALVSLDLAAIYLRQHRTTELKQIAAEMLTIFQALQINREAIAALVLFQKAVELERVSLGLVRDLAAYLKASRHDPRLPFRPSTNV